MKASPVINAGKERPDVRKSALPFMERFRAQPTPTTKAK
jgi:hypothetical protein